jgi:hypothetical protein
MSKSSNAIKINMVEKLRTARRGRGARHRIAAIR